jgi:hypothetical protein
MNGRTILGSACALAISFGTFNASLAQSNPRPRPPISAETDDDWRKDVTVLTIAPDGTWGAATEPFIHRAIANAISDCKSKYKREIGCGHQMTSVRAGWSLAIRCGNENIIASGKTLAAAEQSAINREVELRQSYVPDMPSCVRVVSVDPQGAIVAPNVADSVGMVMRRNGSP